MSAESNPMNPLADGDLLEQPTDPLPLEFLAVPETLEAEFEDVQFEYSKKDELKKENLRNACRLLFVGPPGTGKTVMARYLAHKMDLSFWIVRGDRMVHSLYGHEERAMGQLWDQLQPAAKGDIAELEKEGKEFRKRYYTKHGEGFKCENCNFEMKDADILCGCQAGEMLEKIRKKLALLKESNKPKIIFLDECEALLSGRGSSGDTPKDKALTIFLQRLEAYWGDCIFIAATNMADRLDKALWRRFDKVVEFKMPTKEQRKAALALRLKKRVKEDQLEAMAEESETLSFSELRMAIDNGLKRAILKDEMKKLDNLVTFAIMNEKRQMAIRTKGHLGNAKHGESAALEGWA